MRVHSLFSRLMYLVLLDLKHKDGFDQGTVVTVEKVKFEINVNIVHPLSLRSHREANAWTIKPSRHV